MVMKNLFGLLALVAVAVESKSDEFYTHLEESTMIGEIRMWSGPYPPSGWAFCQGQYLPISENSALFDVIGTIYGGDGETTFSLPDLRGRVPVNPGRGPGLDSFSIGQTGPELLQTGAKINPASLVEVASKHKVEYEQGVSYQYFEGNWDKLPDYNSLIPAKTGLLSDFDTSVHVARDNYGFRYTSNINLDVAGNYTFYTASDDGSLLSIDGTVVVDNNEGEHSEILHAEGDIFLEEGMHNIQVDYYKKDGPGDLEVAYSGPGIDKTVVPSSLLSRSTANNVFAQKSSKVADMGGYTSKKVKSKSKKHHMKHQMPPYIGVNYIIALVGVYPEDDVVDDDYSQEEQDDREYYQEQDDFRDEYDL